MFILKTMNIIDSPVVLLSLAERSYWPKAQRSSDQRKWSVSVLLLWLLLRTLQSKREKDWKKWIPFPKIFIDLHRGKLQMFNHSVLTNQVFLSRVVFGLQHTWWAVSQVTNHRNWTVPGRHLNKARADMLPLRLLSLIERRRLHSSSDANKLNFTLLLSRPLFILGGIKEELGTRPPTPPISSFPPPKSHMKQLPPHRRLPLFVLRNEANLFRLNRLRMKRGSLSIAPLACFTSE